MKPSYRMILPLQALLSALMTAGCAGDGDRHLVGDWAVRQPDYSAVCDFVGKSADAGDYCTALSSTASQGVQVATRSGGVLTIGGPCPLVRMDSSGALSCGTSGLGITLDVRSTWYEVPRVEIGPEMRLRIEGERTGLLSQGLCVIDCGKYVYFYFNGEAAALPSEIRERFNPPLPKERGILKVLFVGNSFNVDATQHLPGMLAANGTGRVLMGRCYRGGCTLAQYDADYSTTNFCSYRTCRPEASVWDGDEEYDTNLEQAFRAEDWDVVTFMEYTGDEACWSWTDDDKAHIESLIEKLFGACPEKRPTVMFMLTQTFAAQSALVAERFGADQSKMYSAITSYARHAVDRTCLDDVIATGTAIENLRTSSLNADLKQDLTRDGYHLDYGVGRYTAACTVWYNIFEPALGLTLDGNAYRYGEAIEHPTQHSIPVTDQNVDLCRHAARAAKDKPLAVTDMSYL